MGENTQRRVLKKVAQTVDWADLAVWLGVDTPLLETWLLGTAAMPKRQFLLVVDLLDKLGHPPAGVPRLGESSNVHQLRGDR